jgi:hypothetical protein
MRTLELARTHPRAFEALPEPYQADDCLIFYTDGGTLCCIPDMQNEEVLGSWKARYHADVNEWLPVE